jgi:hypothetical protein
MGINCPTIYHDANFVGHSNNSYRLNQGFNARCNKPSLPFDNRQQGGSGQNFNRSEPFLKKIVRDQLMINYEIGKKLIVNDKVLEGIDSKMNNFSACSKPDELQQDIGDADCVVSCSIAASQWRRFS